MPGVLDDYKGGWNLEGRIYQIEQALGQLTNVAALSIVGNAVTPDAAAAAHATISASTGSAFTINAPSNPKRGREITLDISNASGGALGTVTFDPAFKLAGSFTAPANGKRRTVSFRYDGAAWVETHRAAADI